MKIKTFALALAVSAAMTGAANATTRTFNISNGTFTDGGTFGGSFDYSDSTYQYSNINLFSKGGIFGDFVYGDRDMDYYGSSQELVIDIAETRYFGIRFSKSLLEAEDSSFLSSVRGYEFDFAFDDREIKSGVLTVAAVPEPATWAMMLLGFGLIGATARYRRKGVQVRYA